MQRIYFVVEVDDGCPVSKEVNTLKEARTELKRITKEDKEVYGYTDDELNYYIAKYTETDDTIYREEV